MLLGDFMATASDGKIVKNPIVCLCGSTRFKDTFERAIISEGKKGNIVLSVCHFTHVDGSLGEDKEDVFRALHFDKIKLCDEVLVLNIGGYIGEQTRKEIEYATRIHKPIRYLEVMNSIVNSNDDTKDGVD